MQVITNNVPRTLLYGYELTEKEREEFDYLDWSSDDAQCNDFVRYKGELYDVGDMESARDTMFSGAPYEWMRGWDGYVSDTFFSGILLRFVDDEHVVMGRYYS